MNIGLAFWVVMLFIAILWGGTQWGGPGWAPYAWSWTFLVLVEVILLGWHVFGAPIHG